MRYHNLTEMATDDAKPWRNRADEETEGGEGNKQLTKMSTSDAKP